MRRRSAAAVIAVVLVLSLVVGLMGHRRLFPAGRNQFAAIAIERLGLRDGDLIFQTSRSAQSDAIQRATGSIWSHMGMVEQRDGRFYVLEAAATVRMTPLADWIARGVGGHFVAKRLADADRRLTPDAVLQLESVGAGFLGRHYDTGFEWSDDRIYCSELVWKIYDRALGIDIGALQKIRDFNLSDPVVAAALRQRYGGAVPLDEPVIAPAAMFASPLLVAVAGR